MKTYTCELCFNANARLIEYSAQPFSDLDKGVLILLFYFCEECLPKAESIKEFVGKRIKTIQLSNGG